MSKAAVLAEDEQVEDAGSELFSVLPVAALQEEDEEGSWREHGPEKETLVHCASQLRLDEGIMRSR